MAAVQNLYTTLSSPKGILSMFLRAFIETQVLSVLLSKCDTNMLLFNTVNT